MYRSGAGKRALIPQREQSELDMATGPASSQAAGAKSFTACPGCNKLCLGPTLLPCGHVTCKKCLRQLLGKKKAACPTCRQGLQARTELQFSPELVLQDLVSESLLSWSREHCKACPNKGATTLCQHCREVYCDACANQHRKQAATVDHVQQLLPHTLRNVTPSPRLSSDSKSSNRPESQSSTLSLDSICNTPRDGSGQNSPHARELLKRETQCLQSAEREVKELAQQASNISIMAQKLAEEAQAKEHILNTYTESLRKAHVRKGRDDIAYVSGLSKDDVNTEVKLEDLQKRLRKVREICFQIPNLDKLKSEMARLILKAPGIRQDPMTATPRPVLETRAVSEEDTVQVCITDLLTTHDDCLVMADSYNEMVKVLVPGGQSVTTLKLHTEPKGMCLLSDGVVAVTAEAKHLYLLQVSSSTATVTSQVQTARQYRGLAQGPDDVTVLASCCKDRDGPAAVDVIGRAGVWMRTVVDGQSMPCLDSNFDLAKQADSAFRISVHDGHVLIADGRQQCVYKVEVSSGSVLDTLKHPDLKEACQAVADEEGNVFVVGVYCKSVMVRSRQGKWKQLLHGDGETWIPRTMCLTDFGMVVAWSKVMADIVIGYELGQ